MVVIIPLLLSLGGKHNVPCDASVLVSRFFLHPRGEMDQTWSRGDLHRYWTNAARSIMGSFADVFVNWT